MNFLFQLDVIQRPLPSEFSNVFLLLKKVIVWHPNIYLYSLQLLWPLENRSIKFSHRCLSLSTTAVENQQKLVGTFGCSHCAPKIVNTKLGLSIIYLFLSHLTMRQKRPTLFEIYMSIDGSRIKRILFPVLYMSIDDGGTTPPLERRLVSYLPRMLIVDRGHSGHSLYDCSGNPSFVK